jgi:ribosomal protein S18 acetylase RimI-like enzyme
MNLDIRNVVPDDFMEIAKLAENCGHMSTMPNAVYHLFTRHFKKTSFVVEDTATHKILGFLLGFISQDDPEESYIHLLCLDPDLRGKGMGKSLINLFEDTVSKEGCEKIKLVTKPHNKISINFYIKMGFQSYKSPETVESEGLNVYKDYDGPDQDKIIFIKSVKKS